MRKLNAILSLLLMTVVIVTSVGGAALAEPVDAQPVQYDATDIVVSAIGLLGLLVAAAFGAVSKKYIIPWIQANHLEKIAEFAVNAAEAIYGAGKGLEKWEWASDYLKKHGISLDRTAIDTAIDAAWNKLNLGQIAAGIKAAAPSVVVNPGARG